VQSLDQSASTDQDGLVGLGRPGRDQRHTGAAGSEPRAGPPAGSSTPHAGSDQTGAAAVVATFAVVGSDRAQIRQAAVLVKKRHAAKKHRKAKKHRAASRKTHKTKKHAKAKRAHRVRRVNR
jgi:hypothetical protein